MRGHRIDEVLPPDKWRASSKSIRTYLKKHKLKNTKSNKKKAAAALKKAHEKSIHPPGKDISFQESASDWQIIYGVQRVDGVFTYVSTADNASPVQKNVYLLLCITLSCHQLSSIDALMFDDEQVTFATTFNANGAAGGATGKFAGYVYMQVNLGTNGQSALSDLVTDSGGDWTTDHRQAGCAHVYLRLKYNDELFPHGLPDIHFQVQGKPCSGWDATYPAGFSRNPAHILFDLLHDSVFGGNRGITFTGVAMSLASNPYTGGSSVEDESLNTCADLVPLAAGGTETNYLCDATFSVTESINGMISKILSSFAGKLVHFGIGHSAGYWTTILAPKYRTPEVALTIADMLSEVQIDTTDSLSDYFGKIGGTHIDNNKNWEETDFPPVIWPTHSGSGSLADPYYDREDITLPCTLSSSMAQRLAKLEMYSRKYGLTISFRTWLKHFKWAPGDNFTLTLSDLGWSSKVFEIQTSQLILEADQNGNDTLTVEITAKENPSTIYGWDELTEERSVAAMPALNYPTPTVSADTDPTSFTATSGNTTYTQQADGSIIPRVLLEWTAPTDALVSIGGNIQIEMMPNGGSIWSRVGYVPGDQEEFYVLDIKVGNSYDFRIRGEQIGGLVGAWVSVTNHTVAGKTDAPSNVSSGSIAYTLNPTTLNLHLSWTGVSDSDLDYYIVKYTTSGAVWAAATLLSNTSSTFVEMVLDAGLNYIFYVKARNRSGVESVTEASYALPGISLGDFFDIDLTAIAPTGSI